jgi:hypothetical protein
MTKAARFHIFKISSRIKMDMTNLRPRMAKGLIPRVYLLYKEINHDDRVTTSHPQPFSISVTPL